MKKSLAYRIAERLKDHNIDWPGGPENAKIIRSYIGHWQRKAWALSWSLHTIDQKNHPWVGSCATATLCAKHGFKVSYDRHIMLYELYPLVEPWAK